MIKKVNDDNNKFSIVESFFEERILANKTKFNGYQLVKYQSGEFAIVNTTIYMMPDKEGGRARKYNDVINKGTEEGMRRIYALYKEHHLGIKPLKVSQLREFNLKDNQKVIAGITSINIDIKNGTAELKLETGKKKLLLKVDKGFAVNLKPGQKISILKVPEGIKINVIRARNIALKRSM